MPFLPLVLLVAWQAVSRSASFALGWATALYFGQVPGRQGRLLAVISLLALAWLVVLIGFWVPWLLSTLLEGLGVIEEGFDVEPLHYVALVSAIVLTPPTIAGCVVYGNFLDERDVPTWLRLVPVSYPATFMLGLSVLQMVLLTPVLLFQRWRQKRKVVQVPLVMRQRADDDDLLEVVETALRTAGIKELGVEEATGPKSWPMRTVAFTARHLLGAVVRGKPIRIVADDLEVLAYATNVAILGPEERTYEVRAAVQREAAFCDAYLTWNDQAQELEDELMAAGNAGDGERELLKQRLDRVQERIDRASLNSEEWNVLYRLRLQLEDRVAEGKRMAD
jgi:hypothetical protein